MSQLCFQRCVNYECQITSVGSVINFKIFYRYHYLPVSALPCLFLGYSVGTPPPLQKDLLLHRKLVVVLVCVDPTQTLTEVVVEIVYQDIDRLLRRPDQNWSDYLGFPTRRTPVLVGPDTTGSLSCHTRKLVSRLGLSSILNEGVLF